MDLKTSGPQVLIRDARPGDLPTVREMLREYQAWLDVDLCFQSFEQELAGLPGAYAPPGGRLLVAEREAELVGTIAYRQITATTCEMKRLFVRPSARGLGLGGALIARALDDARAAGFREMRLDTLPVMQRAQAMYEAAGFHDIPPYYTSPIPGTRFMARTL